MKSLEKIAAHFVRRYERFYRDRYVHLIVDIALLTVIITLSATLIAFRYFRPELFNFPSPTHQSKITIASSSEPEVKAPKKDPSNLKAQAAIYYHSPQGDQLGSGPLPSIG